MKANLKGAAIQSYIAVEPVMSGLAKRFNRILETRLYKYFDGIQRSRWLEILSKFGKAYNEQPQTYLKEVPLLTYVAFINRANMYEIQRKDFPAQATMSEFVVGDRRSSSSTKTKHIQ